MVEVAVLKLVMVVLVQKLQAIYLLVVATMTLLSRYRSKLAFNTGIGVNSTGFFSRKILPWLVF